MTAVVVLVQVRPLILLYYYTKGVKTMAKPVAKAGVGSVKIEVHENRVVYKRKKLFGWKETVIPMKRIDDVSFNKMTSKLENRSDEETYSITTFGAKGVYEAILERL